MKRQSVRSLKDWMQVIGGLDTWGRVSKLENGYSAEDGGRVNPAPSRDSGVPTAET